MNHLTKNPQGIDIDITKVQKELYINLMKRWCGNITGYGRVFKNEDSNGKVTPQVQTTENDYKEVFYDDNFAANFFFMDNDVHTTKDNLVFTAEVKLVFMVNLEDIFDNSEGREDERAHRDAVEFFRFVSDEQYQVKRIEKGVKTVFVNIDKSKLAVLDLQPLHVFAIVFDMPYYLTDKCT